MTRLSDYKKWLDEIEAEIASTINELRSELRTPEDNGYDYINIAFPCGPNGCSPLGGPYLHLIPPRFLPPHYCESTAEVMIGDHVLFLNPYTNEYHYGLVEWRYLNGADQIVYQIAREEDLLYGGGTIQRYELTEPEPGELFKL